MLSIIGFVLLTLLLIFFTAFVLINLNYGGGDCSPLLTGWVKTRYKVLGILLVVLDIYLWYKLLKISPFTFTG